MTAAELKAVADGADVIIDGYAFTYGLDGGCRVLNLHGSHHAAVFDGMGHMTETSMDDIELAIATDYLARASYYVGLSYA